MGPTEIGKVLGRTTTHISKELTVSERGRKGDPMAKDDSKVEALLQDLIIVQLALAGVPGAEIRKVAGVQNESRHENIEGRQKNPESIAVLYSSTPRRITACPLSLSPERVMRRE